jgi:hypothetical protein
VHCFKHKITRKIFAKRRRRNKKKIELNKKWLCKKKIGKAHYKAVMTKRKMRKLI